MQAAAACRNSLDSDESIVSWENGWSVLLYVKVHPPSINAVKFCSHCQKGSGACRVHHFFEFLHKVQDRAGTELS